MKAGTTSCPEWPRCGCGGQPCKREGEHEAAAAKSGSTNVILPPRRDPIPYDEWKRALDQIGAALRPHGLVLRAHIVDGSFSVERLPDAE